MYWWCMRRYNMTLFSFPFSCFICLNSPEYIWTFGSWSTFSEIPCLMNFGEHWLMVKFCKFSCKMLGQRKHFMDNYFVSEQRHVLDFLFLSVLCMSGFISSYSRSLHYQSEIVLLINKCGVFHCCSNENKSKRKTFST